MHLTATVDELPNRASPGVPRGFVLLRRSQGMKITVDNKDTINNDSYTLPKEFFTDAGEILKNLVSLATIRIVHGIGKLRFKPS